MASDPVPPRAFTQGVGTVFQFAGVVLFLLMMFICCGSGLLRKEWASDPSRTEIGWHLGGDAPDHPTYSYQRAMTIGVATGICLGLGLAVVGLGLQAQRRESPWLAVFLTLAGAVFWAVQTAFALSVLHSVILTIIPAALTAVCGALFLLALAALREMLSNPPPRGLADLPADYQTPYSHLHADSPEVRLAREIQERRQRLEVQQKELEQLEKRLRRKIDEG